jgi:hypothetical protein
MPDADGCGSNYLFIAFRTRPLHLASEVMVKGASIIEEKNNKALTKSFMGKRRKRTNNLSVFVDRNHYKFTTPPQKAVTAFSTYTASCHWLHNCTRMVTLLHIIPTEGSNVLWNQKSAFVIRNFPTEELSG